MATRVRFSQTIYMGIFNPSTRQEGLTRLDYFFHVNGYKHLTAKGLPFAVIQPGSDANPGSCKEALMSLFTRARVDL